MAVDRLTACFAGLGHMAKLEYQVCIQCAPVLKGIKVSNMVIVKRNSKNVVKNALKGSGVSCISLYAGKKTEVLLLYRYRLMKEYLNQGEVLDFFRACGYDHMDLLSLFVQLRRKYQEYDNKICPFPHELGVILGYPIEDVKGFMRHEGKDYLLSGHWKVYENPKEAQEIFRLYDQARKTAVRQILAGQTLKEVAYRGRL